MVYFIGEDSTYKAHSYGVFTRKLMMSGISCNIKET